MSDEKQDHKPVIFNYLEYREYLKDWLDYQKQHGRGFSIRKFSKACGVAGGYFTMVIKGERNLTAKAIEKIIGPMKLTAAEHQYLLCLQVVSDSKSQEKRLQALKKMHRYSAYRKSNYDEATLYKYLSNWLHVAIREMVDLYDGQVTTSWIQEKLISKVGKVEVDKALEFLISNNYINVDEDGRATLADKHLKVEGMIHKLGLTAFHKQMFQLATESIDLVESKHRWINGVTMAVSGEQYEQIVKIMQEAKDRISQLDNQRKKNDVVYHTAFVAFPLTKLRGTK